jgi:hypothetical protein
LPSRRQKPWKTKLRNKKKFAKISGKTVLVSLNERNLKNDQILRKRHSLHAKKQMTVVLKSVALEKSVPLANVSSVIASLVTEVLRASANSENANSAVVLLEVLESRALLVKEALKVIENLVNANARSVNAQSLDQNDPAVL